MFSDGTREERDAWRESSADRCNEAIVVAGADEISLDAGVVDAGGEVCVPIVRFKSRGGSSSDEVSSSSSRLPFDTLLGILDTLRSSFSVISFRFV